MDTLLELFVSFRLHWQVGLDIEYPLKTKCSDKLLVGEYVKAKDCEEVLNGLHSVYDKIEDIDWHQLPDKFT